MAVIGGGRFGQIAVERLKSRVRCVVEPQPSPELLTMDAEVVQADGIGWLNHLLEKPDPPRWIMPALPLHLLKEWLLLSLAHMNPHEQAISTPNIPDVPLLLGGQVSQYYLSLADFNCPDDCPEPRGKCTVTGKPRGQAMWQRLAEVEVAGWSNGTLQSHQLAPGVGAVLASDLIGLRDQVQERAGIWLLATACSCHGVLDALEFSPTE